MRWFLNRSSLCGPDYRINCGQLVICLAGGALASWWLGQDANFDLKNYHLYNPFALLEGRHEIDFAVAAFQDSSFRGLTSPTICSRRGCSPTIREF